MRTIGRKVAFQVFSTHRVGKKELSRVVVPELRLEEPGSGLGMATSRRLPRGRENQFAGIDLEKIDELKTLLQEK